MILSAGIFIFGCAESYQIRHLARVIKRFKEQYPDFHYHITSGDTEQVTEKLDKGILDFAVIVEEPDYEKYNVLKMPGGDRWGVIMPSDSPLAQKEQITFDDLKGLPLFCSEQSWRADLPDGARTAWMNYAWKAPFAFPIMALSSPGKVWAIFLPLTI